MVVARKTLVMNKFIVTNRCYIVDLVAKGSVAIFIYPVSALGGFQYISALKKAFPHISMVASQGITIGSFTVFPVGLYSE
ncbi:hypothetical protein JHK82_022354 [Glycine max]|nr:hypothetical protein JHK82_022354 [Glycine max]